MKRLFALLLAIILVFSCVGCGGAPSGGEVTPAESQSAPVESAPVVEDAPFSFGEVTESIYTNEYMGVRWEIDSNWVFYSAEELQDLSDLVNQLAEGTDVAELMADGTTVTAMQAENADTLQSVNINYNKMSLSDRLSFSALSSEELIDALLSEQGDFLRQSYEQVGINNAELTKTFVTYRGEERAALHTAATIQNIPYYITQVYDYSRGRYGITITFASFTEDTTAEMAAMFTALE